MLILITPHCIAHFGLKNIFTSFLPCIYSQYFTLHILEVHKIDAIEWGFVERTKFYFPETVRNGGGREGARLKAEGKATPPHPHTSLPAGKEKVPKLLEFERTIHNTPFPLFVFLGARQHLKETLFILGTLLVFPSRGLICSYYVSYERSNITFAASSFPVSF